MPSRRQTLSPLQVIFTAFPDAVRYVTGQMARVRDVSNATGDRRDQLSVRVREAVARRISGELRRREQHEQLRQRGFAGTQAIRRGGAEVEEDAEPQVLPEIFNDPGGGGEVGQAAPEATRPVQTRE